MDYREERYLDPEKRIVQIIAAQPGYMVAWMSCEYTDPDEAEAIECKIDDKSEYVYVEVIAEPVVCWGVTEAGFVRPMLVSDGELEQIEIFPLREGHVLLLSPEDDHEKLIESHKRMMAGRFIRGLSKDK